MILVQKIVSIDSDASCWKSLKRLFIFDARESSLQGAHRMPYSVAGISSDGGKYLSSLLTLKKNLSHRRCSPDVLYWIVSISNTQRSKALTPCGMYYLDPRHISHTPYVCPEKYKSMPKHAKVLVAVQSSTHRSTAHPYLKLVVDNGVDHLLVLTIPH